MGVDLKTPKTGTPAPSAHRLTSTRVPPGSSGSGLSGLGDSAPMRVGPPSLSNHDSPEVALSPSSSSSPNPGLPPGPCPHPQQRAGLTELMRAGAMVVLMWSTAFRTPGERRGGQARRDQVGEGMQEEGWGWA